MGTAVEALLEDREGTIWAAYGRLILGDSAQSRMAVPNVTERDGRFGSGVTVLCEDSRGNVWAVWGRPACGDGSLVRPNSMASETRRT